MVARIRKKVTAVARRVTGTMKPRHAGVHRQDSALEIVKASARSIAHDCDTLPASALGQLGRLPRELRDHIYSYVSNDPIAVQVAADESIVSTKLTAYVEDTPYIALCCASSVLRDEYLQVAQRQTTLVLMDHSDYEFTIPVLSRRLLDVAYLEVHLILFCGSCTHVGVSASCRAAQELANHRKWLQATVKLLPGLRSIRIGCRLQCCPCVSAHGQLLAGNDVFRKGVEELVQLEKLTELKLAPFDYHLSKVYEGRGFMRVEWSQSGGLVETDGARHEGYAPCSTS